MASRKRNFADMVKAAADTPTARVEDDLPSRFSKAENLLKDRPTGFSSAQEKVGADDATATPSTEEGRAPSATVTPISSPAPSHTIASAFPGIGMPRYEEVPLELIDDNPYNAREIYLPELVSKRAEEMKIWGQLTPGSAVANGERRTLIAGHYRKRSLMLAKLPTMKLMVYDDLTPQQRYEMSFKENDDQNPQTPLDNALVWSRLLKQGVYASEVALAESIGMSKSNVNKTLAILNLDRSVLDVIEQAPEKYALSSLYELTLLEKVAGSREAVLMAELIISDGIGRKDIADRRARFEQPRKVSKRESSRQYKILNGDQSVGYIKEWDSGKVSLEISALDPQARLKLVEELKERFGIGG